MRHPLQNQLYTWENLTLAWQKAARGKRGNGEVAKFELYLADNLLNLETGLREQTYQPGVYDIFYIHEPKKRLISAASCFGPISKPLLIEKGC